jgi:hypothetical protein
MHQKRSDVVCMAQTGFREWESGKGGLQALSRLPFSLLAVFGRLHHGRKPRRSTLHEHASRRSLRTSRAVCEVPSHFGGGELNAAVPTAPHSRTRRPSAPTSFETADRQTSSNLFVASEDYAFISLTLRSAIGAGHGADGHLAEADTCSDRILMLPVLAQRSQMTNLLG